MVDNDIKSCCKMTETNDSASPVTEWKMGEDQELRFEVPNHCEVVVELVTGTAEVFGTELVQHKKYTFGSSSRVAIFSWHGCTVELVGKAEGAYVAKITPMVIYLNTHAALEQLRQQTEGEVGNGQESRGPRIMIVGPTDVGKSTYSKILLNYAVRQGRTPIFVDLDVGQGSIGIPGSVCALQIEHPADPAYGFETKQPLMWHFGHLSPEANIPLYNMLVNNMACVVNKRCQASPETNIAGVVINTCGWIKGDGYSCIVSAAEAFEINVVVVMDHERLYFELQRDLPSLVKIVHQPKSGGVEARSVDMRKQLRRERISQYFYGNERTPYFPHTITVPFDDVKIVKVGVEQLPDSCMPLGMKAEDSRTKVVTVEPTLGLWQQVLAVSMCETGDESGVLETNIAGFVAVNEVDMETKTLTLLSPQPALTSHLLICSDVTFVDDK